MVKFILPLAFSAATLFSAATFGQGLGVCDHVDLEVIKGLKLDVAISADGYETAQLNYQPVKYQGCNVKTQADGKADDDSAALDVSDRFYFFKDRFMVAGEVADAMQAAFDQGLKVRLHFDNDSVIEMDGSTAN